MKTKYQDFLGWVLLLGVGWFGVAIGSPLQAQGLQVCCTTPDLASLVQTIGGPQVSVSTFAKGTEDPHFLEAKPSFVSLLHRADLLVLVGLELESGWLPAVLRGASNPRVHEGGTGYLDASAAIRPLEVPTGPIDRSMGDVHPGGNPHYLLDPICGLQVARLIRDKLSELRPAQKATFQQRYEEFAGKLGELLIGPELARKYRSEDLPKLALLFEHGKLQAYLKSQKEEDQLGGWFSLMLPYYGTPVVDDHNLWPYFARRFGLRVVAHMEPKPGIPPTMTHLRTVAQQMRAEQVRLILTSPYYDPRHAQFLASATGAKVIRMAHQVGSRPGTDDYLSMVDYNVRQVAAGLKPSP